MNRKAEEHLKAAVRAMPSHPLPCQYGRTYITNKWGLDNRHGKDRVNMQQLHLKTDNGKFAGFRLVRTTVDPE